MKKTVTQTKEALQLCFEEYLTNDFINKKLFFK